MGVCIHVCTNIKTKVTSKLTVCNLHYNYYSVYIFIYRTYKADALSHQKILLSVNKYCVTKRLRSGVLQSHIHVYAQQEHHRQKHVYTALGNHPFLDCATCTTFLVMYLYIYSCTCVRVLYRQYSVEALLNILNASAGS